MAIQEWKMPIPKAELQTLQRVKSLLDISHREGVKALLTHLVDTKVATLTKITAWNVLSSLGVSPKPEEAALLRGIVFEVDVDQGVDLLVTYEDHSIHYINYSGKVASFDSPHPGLSSLSERFLSSAKPLLHLAKDGLPSVLSFKGWRAYMLWFADMKFLDLADTTSDIVLNRAGNDFAFNAYALMSEIVRSTTRYTVN